MSQRTIVDIPQIPQEIIDAVTDDKLAIFFGAGTSRSIGCCSWSELAETLVNKCYPEEKEDNPSSLSISSLSISSSSIDTCERDIFSEIKDPKKIITICQCILDKNNSSNIFYETVNDSLKVDLDLLDGQNIYTELYGLRGLFITTNIDTHFDDRFDPSNIICRKEEITEDDIDKSKLYHIHGSIVDRDSVVLTLKNYFDRYSDPKFMAFLRKIFDEKVILFIGYGLSEFEVLDFLFTKSQDSLPGRKKHFILLPYRENEDTKLQFDTYYYSELGIDVIPYLGRNRDYKPLFNVIKTWNQDIILQSNVLVTLFNELKDAANNYDPSKEGKIFQEINNDRSCRLEFFKQLTQSQNAIPWLIPLKNRGYFDPKYNPAPINGYVPYWQIIGVLENIAKLNQINQNLEITHEIRTIIALMIEFKDEKYERISNLLTDQNLIRIIFHLPLPEITQSHFDFIKKCMHEYTDPLYFAHDIAETIIPRLLENSNKELLLKILDIVLDCKKNQNIVFEEYSSFLYSPNLGEYYLNLILETFSERIITLCGMDSIKIALEKIEIIVREDSTQFNPVWIPSIKEDDENSDRYDYHIVHFVWIALNMMSIENIQEITNSLLEKEHPIFKRIAICLIDEHYPELNEIFWNYKENPLQEYHLKTEVYDLFTNHCKEFSESEITQIIDWIETKDYHEDKLSHDLEIQKLYLAEWKKEWLSALLEANNPIVKSLFDKYNQINPVKLSPPNRHPNRSARDYMDAAQSPLLKEELLSKSNYDIAEYLNNFKREDFGEIFVSAHSLGNVLRLSIIDNPVKFVEYLDPFLTVKRLYQSELIYGLSEAWKADKQFNWNPVIQYINSIIDSDEFWTESYQDGEINYRKEIISGITRLFEEGTRNDAHVMDLELLPEVEKILLTLSNNVESDLYPMGDLVTSVLNSAKGNIYSSMVLYSLCFARNYRKTNEIRWPDTIKAEFERRLDSTFEPTVEFSATLGKYLANLCYLDNSWVKNNINKIFSDDEQHWYAAFTAYLFYSKFFKNIYVLLKENGHYAKAIKTDFKEIRINHQLVNHICLGYIDGFELLSEKDSLINQVFDRWDSEQIIQLIRSFRFYGNKLPPEKRPMVISLWNIIISKIEEDPENSDNIKILTEINSWISLADELTDEIYEYLKLSVKYLRPFDPDFIDNLIKHAPSQPKLCGELYLILLNSGQYLVNQKDKIIQFVAILYQFNERKNAIMICNSYLQAGYDFLRPIYEENT